MILAIDIGNTNIVFGCIDDGEILNIVRIQTDEKATSTDYAIKLRQIFEIYEIDMQKIEGAIICSSVPSVALSLQTAIRKLIGIETMVVRPGMKTGMNVKIDDPGSLAGDLVAGSVAAVACYGTPVIVADMGTATTIVLIDESNSYRGGAIIPGVKLSYRALASGTSLLPDISITAPKKVISTNTVDCMRSGAVFGNASMLDGMIERMEAELGKECKVVATGGIAQFVVPHCKHEIICDNDLLLKGLWVLYQKNRKG